MASLKERISKRLPDYSEVHGDLPLVAPGTRGALGELDSVNLFKNEVSGSEEHYAANVGSVAVGELMTEGPESKSVEVEGPQAKVE